MKNQNLPSLTKSHEQKIESVVSTPQQSFTESSAIPRKEYVVLVNDACQPIGIEEKMKTHQDGLLHLSFSVAILRKIYTVYEQAGVEILMQRRAMHKYHTPGLWTNTCCGHPRPGEEVLSAAKRRLFEEFGLRIDLIQFSFFQYSAQVAYNMYENEANHVLIGLMPANQVPKPNPNEIMAYKWETFTQIQESLNKEPDSYTPWFPQVFKTLDQGLKLAGNILDRMQKFGRYSDIAREHEHKSYLSGFEKTSDL